MERPPRDFKGVWIPAEVWLSSELSLMERVLFVEIHSLDNERGCFASNAYFGDFFGISPRQIGTYVSSLKKKGYITVRVENQNQRTIHVTSKYAYAKPAQVRKFHQERMDLANRFRVDTGSHGRKKTARGV